MVRVNIDEKNVRRTALLDALPSLARPLVEKLAGARLLIISQKDATTNIEVAHEALLRKWPTLRNWLDEEKEFLIGKQQLEQDLAEWIKTPKSRKIDALLAGRKLTRARVLSARPNQLSRAERDFIEASVAHFEAQRERGERFRRRLLVASIAAVLLGDQ